MAGPEIIGRVGVKVTPDTRGFARETAAKLKRLKNQKFKVQVEADVEKLKLQVRRAVKAMNAELLADENLHLKFRSELGSSKRDMLSDVRQAKRLYQGMADAEDDVRFDTALRVDKKSLDLDLKPTFDAHEFNKTLQDSINKATKDISLLGDPKTLQKRAEGEAARLSDVINAYFDKNKVRIQVEADKKELEKATADLADAFRTLDRSKGNLFDIEDSLERQRELFHDQARELRSLQSAYDHLKDSGTGTFRQMADYANSITDAEENLRSLRTQLSRLTKKRQAYLDQRIRIDESSVAEAEARVEELRATIEANDAQLDVDLRTLRAEAALDFLARPRTVLINTRVGRKTTELIKAMGSVSPVTWGRIGSVLGGFAARTTGLRLLWQTTTDILNIVPKLDMMIPQLAKTIGLAVPIVSGATAAVASMISIGADAMAAAQAVLLAPAGLAGAGVVIYTIVRAMKDFDKYLPGVKKGFTELGDLTSAAFWGSAQKSMKSFFDYAIPAFKQWIPLAANATGTATGALADGLKHGLEDNIERFFQNLDLGLRNASKGFESLGHAFVQLAAAGSDSFGSLGTWFSDIMGDFDEWVIRNDANGNITKWIEEAGQALRDLGSVIYSTGSLFHSFGEIVKDAGGPSLSDFAAGMRGLRDIFASPEFKFAASQPLYAMFEFLDKLNTIKPQGLEALGTALDLLTSAINTLSDPVIGAIGAVLDGFNSENFGKGFSKFIQGIADFITDVTPGLEVFVSEFGSLLGVVGTAASSFGPAFNDLLELIGNIGHDIHPGLEDFLEFIGPQLQSFIDAVGPGLEDIASAISDLLSNKDFQQFWSDVNDKLKIVVPAIEELVAWLVRLVGAIFNGYSKLPDWMQDLVTWGIALGGVGLGIGRLVGPLGRLAAILATPILKGGLWGAIEGLGKFFKTGNILKGVGSFFAGFGKSLLNSLGKTKIGRALMEAVAGIAGVIKNTKVGQVIGKALLKIFPKSGFIRLLLPKVIGFLGGPIGWVTLILDLIPADISGKIIAGIADALGFDTFADNLRKRLEKDFDGKSLLGSVIDIFTAPFKDMFSGDWGSYFGDLIDLIPGAKILKSILGAIFDSIFGEGSFDKANAELKTKIEEKINGLFSGIWDFLNKPLSEYQWYQDADAALKKWGESVDQWFADLWDGIVDWFKDLFGGGKSSKGSGGSSSSFAMMGDYKSGWLADIMDGVLDWLDEGWSWLVNEISSWKPIATTLNIFAMIGDAIKSLFGDSDGDGLVNFLDPNYWAGIAMKVLTWLTNGWISLVTRILNWTPVQITIDFLSKIWGWIKDLLGLDGEFDFLTPILDTFTTIGDTVLGALDTAWEGLKSRVLGWGDGKSTNAGGGLKLDSLLGVDAGGLMSLQGGFAAAQGSVNGFSSSAGLSFGNLAGLVKEKMLGIKTDVSTNSAGARDSGVANFGTLAATGIAKAAGMATSVGSSFSSMRSKASTETGSMKSKTSSDAEGMKNMAARKALDMANRVKAKFVQMRAQAVAESRGMSSGVSAAMSPMPGQAGSTASRMKNSFIAPLRSMQAQARGIATATKSGVISGLSGNASGSGRRLGSTFASGLSAAASRAVSIARSIVSRVKGALSGGSAFSSGAAIGRTFASGIASKVGAAASAAARLAAAARGHLPNSPAKEGPFSGSGWGGWGESIGDELARGLTKSVPAVAKAATEMMSAVSDRLGESERLSVRPDVEPAVAEARRSRRTATQSTETATAGSLLSGGVTVNVESRSNEPLDEGARFARDLQFALEGM